MDENLYEYDESRRDFLKKASAIGIGAVALEFFDETQVFAEVPEYISNPSADAIPIKLNINGAEKSVQIDTRSSLLDTLRERLDLTGFLWRPACRAPGPTPAPFSSYQSYMSLTLTSARTLGKAKRTPGPGLPRST